MRRLSTFLLIAFLCSSLAHVAAASKPEMRRVYMFGFAASFKDSTACQTTIQMVDSAWIDPQHKFLMDRSLYSLQLQYHMESVEKCKNSICSVFFSTNPRKLKRTWRRIQKRYEKNPSLQYVVLTDDRFRFQAEEYRQILVGDEAGEAVPAPTEVPRPQPPVGEPKPQR
jgi:hypothetical protein